GMALFATREICVGGAVTSRWTRSTRRGTLRVSGGRQEVRCTMPKYLVSASYSSEGAKGVLDKGGTARADAVRKAVEGMGGKMESFHFAFGSDDAIVLVELPDNVAAAALGLTVSATGLAATRTTVLLTPEEVDQSASRSVAYTPPGQ